MGTGRDRCLCWCGRGLRRGRARGGELSGSRSTRLGPDCRCRTPDAASWRRGRTGSAAHRDGAAPGARSTGCRSGTPASNAGSARWVSSATCALSRSLPSASRAVSQPVTVPIAARTGSVIATPTEKKVRTLCSRRWRRCVRNACEQPAESVRIRMSVPWRARRAVASAPGQGSRCGRRRCSTPRLRCAAARREPRWCCQEAQQRVVARTYASTSPTRSPSPSDTTIDAFRSRTIPVTTIPAARDTGSPPRPSAAPTPPAAPRPGRPATAPALPRRNHPAPATPSSRATRPG